MRAREQWSREQVLVHQGQQLAALRRHAYQRSAFYQRFHGGLESAPLDRLPVLTKAALMEHFDEVTTDPALRLAGVQRHLASLSGNQRYMDRYWVCTTAGTTGARGVFPIGFSEWMTTIASYARAQAWGGAEAGVTRRVRLAVVSSTAPWHQSWRVGTTVDSWWVPTLRIDAAEPLAVIVERLQAWQPEHLVGYPSILGPLAEEQLAGRLNIRPATVFTASEVLSDECRQRIEQAWGAPPFNVYGATETSTIGADCEQHRMHLFEDLVITEVVDDRNRPVPAGEYGAKVLVTVLFSRTLPLIRYEMSDSIAMSTETCGCGRPFGLMEGVRGRAEDELHMTGQQGRDVVVHPNLLHRTIEAMIQGEWQVVQREGNRLELLLTQDTSEQPMLQMRLTAALQELGVSEPSVEMVRVAAIPRTAAGKRQLVVGRKTNP